jgi:hypothetical protein
MAEIIHETTVSGDPGQVRAALLDRYLATGVADPFFRQAS